MQLDEKGELYVQSMNGKKTPVNLEENNSNVNNDIKSDTKTDSLMVKNCCQKLCLLSNQIVKTQLKLDKLNIVLKQLSILQTIRFNISSSAEKSFFLIEKTFNEASFEVTIKNKNIQLDDNFNRSYLILTSIQLNKPINTNQVFYFLSKCDFFDAIKPNTKHTINFKLSEILKNRYFPYKISIYLIFDVRNYLDLVQTSENQLYLSLNEQYLFEIDKKHDNYLSEFAVCIYDSKLDVMDFFSHSELESSNRKSFENNEVSLVFK